MRLIDADKIHPDVRTQRGALAISQGQLAYAETVNAILIPNNATNGDVIKALFPDCDETGVQYELTKNCNGWLDEPYQKRGCFRPTDDNSGTFCI